MNNLKTRHMVTMALLSAIIVVMTFVPNTGYIQTGIFSITIIHIPVIIGSIMLGPTGGAVLGFIWGITSLLKSLTMPEGVVFSNPLISVLPRIIVGILVGLLAKYLYDRFKNKIVLYLTCAIAGTLANTVLVLSAIGLFAGQGIAKFGQTLLLIVQITVSLNGVIELVSAAIFVPVITSAVVKSLK